MTVVPWSYLKECGPFPPPRVSYLFPSFLLLLKSLTSFEYVEPNGKDMGINVRKKAENIVALLNNKEKIEDARNKAAANRDK